MRPFSANRTENITQLGTIARSCLAPGQRGSVLAAFSKAIYLVTGTGELFWIATETAAMHRRCALASAPLPGPSAGAPFHVESQRLTIDPAFVFNVGQTLEWRAPGVLARHVLELAQLPGRIQVFFSNLDLSQAKGFGEFIRLILQLMQNESITLQPALADPILKVAYPLVLQIARACLEHHPSQLSQKAEALIGLGTGLTPSGDDFLGGLLFAIKILQAAYPGLSISRYAIPVESYASQTNLISFTILSDLADGHAIEPLHHIINGLLSGEAPESMYPSVLQLTRVGHSTGWDLLTGLLTGLLITYRMNAL